MGLLTSRDEAIFKDTSNVRSLVVVHIKLDEDKFCFMLVELDEVYTTLKLINFIFEYRYNLSYLKFNFVFFIRS